MDPSLNSEWFEKKILIYFGLELNISYSYYLTWDIYIFIYS